MSKHILLVDDDALMRRSLALGLEQAGYRASTVASAEDALKLIDRDPTDLVLLDIGLPGMDGLDALRILKDQMGIPVIFLTARRREIDQILGLELGADDYLAKPVNLDLILAHVKAVLRRSEPYNAPSPQLSTLSVGNLDIDPATHTVRLGSRYIGLRPREFALLYTLASKPGVVFSVNELITSIWGREFVGESQVVYVHIRWLRQKLEENPESPCRIITVPRIGYKLIAQENRFSEH